MPIGAIIGGAAAIGGAVIGSKAQSKAAQTASDTSLAVAEKNNALARDIYGQNQAALSPFMQRGNAAGNQINALLGLGGSAPQAANNNQPTTGIQPNWGAGFGPGFSSGMPNGAMDYGNALASFNPRGTIDGRPVAMMGMDTMPNTPFAYNRAQPYAQTGVQTATGTPQTAPQGQNAQQAANDAFDVFRNSTGYQFRLGQGMDAINSGYAGAGTLQSGAAMKAINEYGQNFASNEFGNYMGALQGQQAAGLGGASALAGVGQNYAGLVTQNNNAAGTAAANAALVRGANNPWANALGTIGGLGMSGVFGGFGK